MKRITLASIRDCLQHLRPRVEVPDEVAPRARSALLRMLELTARQRAASAELSAASKQSKSKGV